MSKYNRVIFESNNGHYRIIEMLDECASFEDLCGDCFDYEKSGYTGTREELAMELEDFRELVNREGVFGYVLERWNPEPGQGYEHVDSCFGFVGRYSPTDKTFNHYIVDELKSQILKEKETA